MLIFGKRKLQELCIQVYVTPETSIRVMPIWELPIFFAKMKKGA